MMVYSIIENRDKGNFSIRFDNSDPDHPTLNGKGIGDGIEVDVTFPKGDAQLKHIFRDAEGHLTDTPTNRQKILDVASNLENYLGKDARGNDWYVIISEDGTQTWVRVRNGVIDNAGVNDVPRSWDSETGLYNNAKK